MMETVWRLGNLGLAFALELSAIAALGYWGFHVPGSATIRIVLGIGAPALAIVLWALFAAPKATFAAPAWYGLTAALVFGGAAAGLWMSDQRVPGVLLPVLFVANLAIIKAMHLDAVTTG
jgi:hypothetical protein